MRLAHVVEWERHHGPVPAGFQVHHKNEDKQDNRIDNLEVVTGAENIRHSYANGRPAPWSEARKRGLYRGRPIITHERGAEMVAARGGGALLREVADRFGVSITHAQRLTKGA